MRYDFISDIILVLIVLAVIIFLRRRKNRRLPNSHVEVGEETYNVERQQDSVEELKNSAIQTGKKVGKGCAVSLAVFLVLLVVLGIVLGTLMNIWGETPVPPLFYIILLLLYRFLDYPLPFESLPVPPLKWYI